MPRLIIPMIYPYNDGVMQAHSSSKELCMTTAWIRLCKYIGWRLIEENGDSLLWMPRLIIPMIYPYNDDVMQAHSSSKELCMTTAWIRLCKYIGWRMIEENGDSLLSMPRLIIPIRIMMMMMTFENDNILANFFV